MSMSWKAVPAPKTAAPTLGKTPSAGGTGIFMPRNARARNRFSVKSLPENTQRSTAGKPTSQPIRTLTLPLSKKRLRIQQKDPAQGTERSLATTDPYWLISFTVQRVTHFAGPTHSYGGHGQKAKAEHIIQPPPATWKSTGGSPQGSPPTPNQARNSSSAAQRKYQRHR